ncbi:MAG: tRNA (adenine37-N6)-methyltransferase [Clostridiales bacterium]|jgi:tRNA-Thr(GGU) m(6)t(6)A37 methyltransferase TsaA|nr:tRNA (adenine37-N6)-methyltransferase [Clostridiales bacterium]MDN5283595.1 tRNA (adenine37-N6)-methyltransferase [Candidatus Ozemobacter sp.]
MTTSDKIEFKIIGQVRSRFKEQKGTPIQGKMAPEETAELIIAPEYAEGLKDLEGFSHIYVFFKFDRADHNKLLVKPYLDTEDRGVFSTRSPLRPNPLGMTIVRLERIEENRLYVSGVDILDGSPIIDIKPYIPDFDQHNPEKIGWYAKNQKRSGKVLADDRFDKNSE